jgi:hypothetical protein
MLHAATVIVAVKREEERIRLPSVEGVVVLTSLA